MSGQSSGRILVVDDNPPNVALIRAQLERAGYTVLTAADGPSGLAAATADRPDLIILDVMMPGLDGYAVCRRLKEDDATRSVPVVMLTSLHERADMIRGLDAGADEFLTKPTDPAELLARVRSLLRLKHTYDQLVLSRDTLAEQAEQLATEKSRAEAILQAMSDGVITTDRQGRITTLNPAAEALARVPVTWALGQPWRDALGIRAADGQPMTDETCPILEACRANGPTARAVSMWPAPEQEVAVSLAAAPIRAADGHVTGAVAVLRDVTRQREVERMKREFIRLVSHELRTPLTSVIGFAELLANSETLGGKERDYADMVFEEAQRLTDLVNDFLDIERMESGRMTFQLRSLNLGGILARVSQNLTPQLSGHDLIVDLPQNALQVHVDSERLIQVLTNLVSNAIKYSPDGGEVRVRAREEAGAVVIDVSDAGLGIPADALPRLFEKFYRVDRKDGREIAGTGLGLAICKQIVEGWGGWIRVASPGSGRGSTFSFSVPLGPPLPSDGGETGTAPPIGTTQANGDLFRS